MLEDFIGGLIVNFRSRGTRAGYHIEVVESYKDRILSLEIELEYHKLEKDKYEKLLFVQLGINQDRSESNEERQVIHRPMSPLKMRQSLEAFSRKAASDKK